MLDQYPVVNMNDNPNEIIRGISSKKCFIAGGGKTNSRFYSFLTHLYITPHPYVFGAGVPLFDGDITEELKLNFQKMLEVEEETGIYQYQYEVIRRGRRLLFYNLSKLLAS